MYIYFCRVCILVQSTWTLPKILDKYKHQHKGVNLLIINIVKEMSLIILSPCVINAISGSSMANLKEYISHLMTKILCRGMNSINM